MGSRTKKLNSGWSPDWQADKDGLTAPSGFDPYGNIPKPGERIGGYDDLMNGKGAWRTGQQDPTGTLPGRGPNGEMPSGMTQQPSGGKIGKPFSLYGGMQDKPGTRKVTEPEPYTDTPPITQVPDDMIGGQPPSAGWNQFDFWNPNQNYQGMGWNKDYRVNVPPVDPSDPAGQAKIDAANFLNMFNMTVPYLSPSDLGSYSQQINQALDVLDDKTAAEYFRGLAMGTSGTGMQARDTVNYNDRDRLREVRQVLNQGFTGGAGSGMNDILEMEPGQRQAIDLLDIILGNGATGSQGIWTEDRGPTRRERAEMSNRASTYFQGVDENDPVANLIMSILYPTTNSPQLNTYIHAPQRSGASGNGYTYGYSNSRY